MDLIFFDLDGTLLNSASEISPFTKETLILLNEKDKFRSEMFELGISPSVVSKTGKKSNDSFWFAYSYLFHTKLISFYA